MKYIHFENGRYRKRDPEYMRKKTIRQNPKTNAISAITYKKTGGYKLYFALPKDERLRYRAIATKQYEREQINMNSLIYTKIDGKYYKDNPEAQRLRNPRTNSVSGMVYKDAGGYESFYNLPKSERLRLRIIAGKEYDETVPFKRAKRKLPKVNRPKSKRVTTIQVDDPRGFVYIFKDHMKSKDLYKIGASHEPQERLDQANTWGDFESIYESEEVTDCAKLEKEVHQSLGRYQVKGEWFKVSEDLAINTIKEIVNESFNYAVAS